MFLAAIGEPKGDFDGKVGIWAVTEDYVAKRKSKYHDLY